MSHNVKIEGIKITSLDVLDRAIAELRRDGINVMLERGVPGKRGLTFRTYHGYGNSTKADSVIRLPGAAYDIGLLHDPKGFYSPIFDNMLGISIPSPIACKYVAGEKHDGSQGHAMGKLMQRYAAILAETDAQRRGYHARRVTGSDGTMQVVIQTR